MFENENQVTEQVEQIQQVTEPAVQTADQPEKKYTQDEVNEIVTRRLSRQEAKIRKENDRKYGGLMEVLTAGTGKKSVEEVKDTFTEFYKKKGIQLPQKPQYSQKDIEVLANADAEEFIRNGFEDVVEEVDRLANLGIAKMTDREKVTFKKLAEYRQAEERGRALASHGVTEDVSKSKEFQDFASKFSSKTPVTEIYDLFEKSRPKKEIHTMGSMKAKTPQDNGVKDFYTYEEAMKFSKADFDKDPALYKKVVESMQKW